MSRRVLLIVLAGALLGAVLAWLLLRGEQPAVRRELPATPRPLPTPTPAPEQQVVLLFVGGDGQLHPELRSVPLPSELDQRVRAVVVELVQGPAGGLAPLFPYSVEVSAVFVDGAGNAYVDLTPPPVPLEGSHIELMLAYGVVDSVLLNCPELRAVQILFGGREVETLTGHLDMSRPLVLNKRFIGS